MISREKHLRDRLLRTKRKVVEDAVDDILENILHRQRASMFLKDAFVKRLHVLLVELEGRRQ